MKNILEAADYAYIAYRIEAIKKDEETIRKKKVYSYSLFMPVSNILYYVNSIPKDEFSYLNIKGREKIISPLNMSSIQVVALVKRLLNMDQRDTRMLDAADGSKAGLRYVSPITKWKPLAERAREELRSGNYLVLAPALLRYFRIVTDQEIEKTKRELRNTYISR